MYYVPAAQTAVDSKSSATKLLDAQLEDALGDFMSSPIRRPKPAAAAAPAAIDESSNTSTTTSSTVGAAAVATTVSDERGRSPSSSVTGSDSDADERGGGGGGGGGGVILASSAEKTRTRTTTKAPTPAPTTTVDVILRELRAIHELELSLTAKCEIQQFGLEQSGIWLGAKIVAVNGVLVRQLEEVRALRLRTTTPVCPVAD